LLTNGHGPAKASRLTRSSPPGVSGTKSRSHLTRFAPRACSFGHPVLNPAETAPSRRWFFRFLYAALSFAFSRTAYDGTRANPAYHEDGLLPLLQIASVRFAVQPQSLSPAAATLIVQQGISPRLAATRCWSGRDSNRRCRFGPLLFGNGSKFGPCSSRPLPTDALENTSLVVFGMTALKSGVTSDLSGHREAQTGPPVQIPSRCEPVTIVERQDGRELLLV
jgi:hypothetical protein